jgi:hypothetical protein
VMRQLARARIGVAVAQPLVLEHHRIRVRCARHLRRKARFLAERMSFLMAASERSSSGLSGGVSGPSFSGTSSFMAKARKKRSFNVKAFLSTVDGGRTTATYRKDQTVKLAVLAGRGLRQCGALGRCFCVYCLGRS